MTHEMMIAILEEDGCTRSEAEKHLKNETVIFDSPEDYIEMLKANDCYEGETVEDIRKGMPDTSLVTYEGHEYVIMHSL